MPTLRRLAVHLFGVDVLGLSAGNRRSKERSMAGNGTGTKRSARTTAAAEAVARGSRNTDQDQAVSGPRSGQIARIGVKTGEDFANLMSALMSDVIEGAISPNVANAAVNAGGKLLKVVEMQYRYGSQQDQRAISLTLAPG